MKKIRIIFDISIIVHYGNGTTSSRSGIFWTTYNMLKEFELCPFFKTILYSRSKNSGMKNTLFNLPYVFLPEKPNFQQNIDFNKQKIKTSKNFYVICIECIKMIKNLIYPLFWDLYIKAKQKKLGKYDAFFSPYFAIPDFIKTNSSIKVFHMLYDCIPILDGVPYEKNITEDHPYLQVQKYLNKETYYFCISQCTKKDFLRIAPEKLDETKMFVTPIATSQAFLPLYDKQLLDSVLKKYDTTLEADDCYIFSLCSIDPRKNLVFTIKCFIQFIKKHSIENMYFLLGGAHFTTYIEQFTQEIAGFADFQDKIRKLGYIDDEDVNILYSNSLFFTFLSQYEGFGMPPLEAMQAGTPVICSNNSSLPEVVGDAAITITYNDEEACIKAFEDFYFNKELRKEYIKKGLERAKLFSWKNTFKKMSEKISDICNNN